MANAVEEIIATWRMIGYQPGSCSSATKDSTFDSLFADLRNEIRKSEQLAGERVDWTKVISWSRALLENSKDIQVGAYLCYALLRRDGHKGLLGGISCLSGLAESYKTDQFGQAITPGKNDKRILRALEWLSEKLADFTARTPPEAKDASYVAACLEVVRTVESDDESFLKPLFGGSWLERLKTQLETQPAEPAVESPSRNERRNTPSGNPSRQPLANSDGVDRASAPTDIDLAGAWRTIVGAATQVRTSDRRLAWPYQVCRLACWKDLREYPPHHQYKTRIPPPAKTTIERLPKLEQNGEWQALLDDCESHFIEYPLWLDLQRFSCAAVAGLDLGEEPVLAVRRETLELLRRLPELQYQTFSNGTPFADAKTRAWLQEAIAASVSVTASGDARPNPVGDPLQRAVDTLRKAAFTDTVAMFNKLAEQLPSGRDRFQFRLIFAELCIKEHTPELAMAQFKLLNDEVVSLGLEDWDPHITAQFLQAWWWMLAEKRSTLEVAVLSDQIYTRLSRIDPVLALRLLQPKSA